MEEKYDYKTHNDFKKYYDSTRKRNYWVLGYFGGGSINIVDAYDLAKEYAEANKVELNTVKIDEILHSRRYKGFKFIYSGIDQEPDKDAYVSENVYGMLSD